MIHQACNLMLLLQLLTLIGLSYSQSIARKQKKLACSTSSALNTSAICTCTDHRVDCNSRNPQLEAVPYEILRKSTIVSLNGNSIRRIEQYDFERWDRVEELYIQSNGLSYIHEEELGRMVVLRQLELQFNNMERIEKKLFLGLDNIENIFFSYNKISFIHPDAFEKKFKLKLLDLRQNRLNVLHQSGRTFQHLLSLNTLYLQINNISTVNKYSFLTMVLPGTSVRVNLDENPIHCDCNTRRLQSLAKSNREVIIDMKCNNDPKKMPFGNITDSVFGDCISTETIFDQEITCDRCSSNSTNYGCRLHKEKCYGETVCQKSVKWDADAKTMMVDGHCEQYKKCLANEGDNRYRCNTDSLTNRNVTCHFCCRGSTCRDDSIGGVTRDFRFTLSYNTSSTLYQPFMNNRTDPQYQKKEKEIAEVVRKSVKGFTGGFDVHVLHFKPPHNNQYQVVLGLEVTVFNTKNMNEKSVGKSIEHTILLNKKENTSIFLVEKLIEGTFEISPNNEDSAKNISDSLNNSTDNLTVDAVNNTLNHLEQLLNKTTLQQPDRFTSILKSVNKLMNIEERTLLAWNAETAISRRLLTIIDEISENAPLKEDRLKVVFPNIAVLALGVNNTDTRDIILTIGGFTDSMVNIGISERNHSSISGLTSMVFPNQAIATSLTDKKDIVRRVAFAVHKSDKLFLTEENLKSKVTPEADTEENFLCGKHNSKACTRINSYIISARILGIQNVSEVQNLSENIIMNFVHDNINATNPRCVFWKFFPNGTGEWSGKGCHTVKNNSGETTCSCNHLTNFALLMDIYQEGNSMSDEDRNAISKISYAGCGISFFALLLTILTYSVCRRMVRYDSNNPRRKLRGDNPSKILINLCLALMLSNLVFVVGMQKYTYDNTISCKVVPVLLHYFLLSSLTWMAVEAFYMYLAIVLVFKTHFNHFLLKCSLVGWGVPLVIIIITLSVNVTENYGFISSGLCWLRNTAFYTAFVGPVCLILFVNCIAFGLVIKQLVNISKSNLNKTERYSTIQNLRAAVGVVILLGLTWLFAIFAVGQASVVFYYLFTVFNSLQGLFIFIYYCLLKKDVITIWKRLLPCCEESGETFKSSSESKAMTAAGATHHLVKKDSHSKSQSKSSSFSGNTVSTFVNSGKNSYLSSDSTNNSAGNNEECETPILTETESGTVFYKKKSSHLM